MMPFILLLLLVIAALMVVNYVNQWQQRQRRVRTHLLRLRLQVEHLEEVMVCLTNTLPQDAIALHINQEIVTRLKQMLDLETGPSEHLETALTMAEERAQELAAKGSGDIRPARYSKESDAQIAQAQHCLNEASKVLRLQASQNRLPDSELEQHLKALSWASLMVSVASFITQGHKASHRGDYFSAQAFYKKAQTMLINSTHTNPDRMRLIRELGELVSGNRENISVDLLSADSAE